MDHLATLFPMLARLYPDVPEVREGLVFIAWRYCVGERIRNISHPVRFQDGILEVSVSSVSWQSTLSSMTDEIRSRVNEYLKEPLLTQVRIRVEG